MIHNAQSNGEQLIILILMYQQNKYGPTVLFSILIKALVLMQSNITINLNTTSTSISFEPSPLELRAKPQSSNPSDDEKPARAHPTRSSLPTRSPRETKSSSEDKRRSERESASESSAETKLSEERKSYPAAPSSHGRINV
jgi:hypothetical protein